MAENNLAGNPSSEWDIAGAGDLTIQGFATDISVNKGQTVHFKISTDAAAYAIDIYRLGYYNGLGARKVGTGVITATLPQSQPSPLTDLTTGLVDCGNWGESAHWDIPSTAVSGIYIAKLKRTDNGGASHIVFIVRDDASHSNLFFQASDATWQAYNVYGGNSLYVGSTDFPSGHAAKVSYNRPFITRSGGGGGGVAQDWVFNTEYPMIRFLERNGYDLSYTTNTDAARFGSLILNHKVYLSVGHDEYWSAQQRANVQAARNAGVHLAFFSGNDIYWKTRWENSTDASNTPYRTLVCYKEGTLGEAVCDGKCDPSPEWTGLWRDGCDFPGSGGCNPENNLSGQISWQNGSYSITVPSDYKNLRFWRNTGVASLNTGDVVTFPEGTLGNEWDFEQFQGYYPAGRITLSSTTINGKTHKMSLYRHSSGALVFAAGTIQWAWGLDDNHDITTGTSNQDMQQATVNVLADMGVQPATLMAGLQPASQSTDTQAPSSVIGFPTHLQTLDDWVPITITGTASDAGGGVLVGVEISFDDGATWQLANGTTNWSYSWKPSGHSSYTIQVRGFDDSGNIEEIGADGSSNSIIVNVNANLPPPVTVFQPTDVPDVALQNTNDGGLEVGMKFQATQNGSVTALRFYKGAGNTGVHKGHLWSSTGQMLAEATFSNESVSGWQEVTLSTPVNIIANTTYIVSYYTPDGFYSKTNPFFTTAVTNGPLRGLATGEDGPNGVFKFSSSPAFPNQNFETSNYWADVVFIAADIAPPLAASITPANGSTNVSITSSVQVAFSEPIDPTTVSSSTFELRNASGTLIPATVSYNFGNLTATLTPDAPLSYITTYTVTLKGGTTGLRIKDLAANALAGNVTRTFTTQFPPGLSPLDGPGGPILVLSTASNPFSRFPVEILRAEGLNEFAAADISTITSASSLSAYDVVVLGEMSLTANQVSSLTTWVNAGGTLIAFRPGPELNDLLGLTASSGTLADKYLLVNTASGPGLGIVNQTMQFHGTADLHTLTGGAISLATLYSDATNATTNPAVSMRTVGSGKAVAFTFDLARSIVYTRQGNPAQAGLETDGIGPKRSDDLFFPDYLDMNKVQIPQADEQQRLLANIIIQANLAKKPLPRFWYLPSGNKAAVVYTVDDHGTASGTEDIFDKLIANSPPGGNVTDWTAYRATSWFYLGIPLTDQEAANYNAQGFEMGVHVQNDCDDFNSFAQLDASYIPQLNAFRNTYPSLPPQTTHRFHCIVWSDWLTQAKVELSHGIRYSMDYYYWPPSWIQGRPGLFTGSGMPMRFADLNGDLLDVYQGVSDLVNENEVNYALGVNTLLDNALGSKGYYGLFGTHDDYRDTQFSTDVINSAKAHNVPIISAKQALTWLDGRNNSSFSNMTWTNNQLSFTVTAYNGADNLKTMLPVYSSNGQLSSVTRNGSAISFTTETIKGIQYAFVDAPVGINSFVATYTIDNTAPAISNIVATPNADGISATITWTTNEGSDSRVDYGTVSNNLNLSVSDNTPVTSHSIVLTGLNTGTTYHFRVTSKDLPGNAATSPALDHAPLNFTTPSVCAADVTAADFDGGTHSPETTTSFEQGGAVILKPVLNQDFEGTTLPADWSSAVFDSGNTTVGGGTITVDGTHAYTNTSYPAGTSIEFVATFNLGTFQAVGFTSDQAFNTDPWVVIGQGGAADGGLYARASTGEVDNLGNNLLGSPHRFRIKWNADNFQIFVDGHTSPDATVNFAVSTNMFLQISDVHTGDGALSVDWIRVLPYPASGTFTSRVFDAGVAKSWGAINWNTNTPAGTSVVISVRTGNTAVPDGTWTAFAPVVTPGSVIGTVSRYIQYKADLATSDINSTPLLNDLSITCSDVVTPPVVTTHPGNQTVCTGTPVTFTSAASGMPAPVAQWQVSTDGTTWTDIPEEFNGTLSFTATVADNNKQYRALWNNGSGLVNSNPATLIVNPIPVAPTVTVTDNCGSSQLTASNATGTLLWSNNATTPSIVVTDAATYTVTQTLNGCTSPAGSGTSAPKIIPSAPSVSVVNNCGSSELTAANFTGSLLWNTGATTNPITVTSPGTYTVVQIINGCSSANAGATAAPKTIPAAPAVNVVNNCGSSVLTASGFTGSLLWSNGATTSSINVTNAATYTVTQTVNGCTSAAGSGISAPKIIPAAPTVTVTDNCGNSVLTASNFTGSLLWSNGATTPSITVTNAATYTVTQTVTGCTSPAGSGTSAPKAIPAAPTVTVVNNCGTSVLTASNFTGSLLWSNGATTPSITVSNVGTYTATQTAANGCTSAAASGASIPRVIPPAPVISVKGPSTFCQGGNVTLSSNAKNNNLWSNGATTQSILVTTSGTYTVTYTNEAGCSTISTPVTITVNPIPSAPTINVVNNCGNSVLTAANYSGTLLWNTGATTSSVTTSNSGLFTVRQTVNGCISPVGSGISAPKVVPVAPTVVVTNNCGSADLVASNFSGTLLWSNAATTSSINVTDAATYSVTQTTANGCISPAGSAVSAPKAIPSAPVVSVVNNCGSSELTASEFTGSLLWSNAATTSSINVTDEATYTVTQTTANGCTSPTGSAVSAPKSIPSAPSVSVINNCGNSVLTASNVNGSLTWSEGGLSTPSITVNISGTYTVTQTMPNGCTSLPGGATAEPKSIPVAPTVNVSDNCASSILTASNVTGSLLWSNNETTASITVTSAGTYTVTQTADNGCTSAAGSGTATPSANLPVSVTISANTGNIVCAGTEVTFTATPSNGGSLPAYQWYKGTTAIDGATGSTYVVVPADGDEIHVVLTSNESCAIQNPATSNSIVTTVNANLTPTVSISSDAPGNTICAGTTVTFTATASNAGGGTITYDFKVNGASVQAGSSNTFSTSALNNNDAVTVDISVAGGTCLTTTTAASNSIATTVNANLTPAVSISSDATGNAICSGMTVTFTATAGNTGGGTITYDFKVNGISAQNGASNIYTTSALADQDAVTVDISVAGGTCLTTTTATSNSIATTVSTNLTPTVTISSDATDNTICAGTTVTFTAAVGSTGGGTVTYDFKVGGTSVQNGSSNTYTTSSLADGNTVTVDISIVGGTCLTTTTASSSTITMTVNANLTPTVSLASSAGTAICAGTEVTFTATASNTGGGTITYDFKVNGASVQTGSSNTYSTSALNNNDAVTVDISVAGGTCLTTTTATSNSIATTVNANLTPTVSISSDATGNAICSGMTVTFTATAGNTGGGTITYDFKVNGISAQNGASNIYTTSALADQDAVTVDISVADGTCLTTTTATSNSIATTVSTNLTPTVTISSDATDNTICAGTTVTFTAAVGSTSGGTVTYDFKLNGTSVQSSTSNTYATSTLVSGDAVTVDISVAGGTCLTTTTATSNSIATTVNANLTPTVSLASSAGTAICAGTEVTFTATASNTGGGTITYDFKVAGISVQSGSSNTYTTSSLASGEAVTVDISVAGGTCLTTTTATSNSIATTVNANLTPTVSISSDATGDAICSGMTVTFTATALNTGGGTITYDFKVNGNSVQNGSSNIYTTSALVDQDAVTVDISVAGGTCLTTTTATSNSIATTVSTNLTPTVSISSDASANTICAGTTVTFTAAVGSTGGGTVTYDFKLNGTSVQSSTSNTYATSTLVSGDAVTVDISVAGGTCLATTTATSNSIATTVNANLTPTVSLASSAGTAICAGTEVTFTATAGNTGGGTITYDFKVAGISVQSGSSNTYTTSSLASGEAVTVDISVAGGTCLTTATATSNSIATTVNANLTPAVSISSDATGNAICSGMTVTFTATAGSTGGGTITYDFKVNGNSVQNGSSNIYTTSALVDQDAVTVDISVTGGTCLTTTTATSNSIATTVSTNLTPTVSISSDASGNTICAGTTVTFTAAVGSTGGGTVTYDFKLNGTSVQSSASNTYATSTLVSGDAVTVDISVAGGTCLATTTATSNSIATTVNANLTPTVSLASSAGTAICAGTEVTFTATANATGGGTITYDFKVNGISAQTGSSNTYSTSALVDQDAVTVDISVAGGTCLTTTTATSNSIATTVNANLTPTVSLTSSAGTTICAGTEVTFTATASNTGGGTITYDFKVNGISAQNGASNIYTASALADQDAVTVDISVADGTCLTTTTATSNSIATTVNANLTPTVSISSDATDNTICAGTTVTFTAAVGSTGGGTVTYDFKLNGTSVQSSASNTYATSTLVSGDAVTVDISVAGGTCLTTTTATSNSIATTVNANLTPTVSISSDATGDAICSGMTVTFTATALNTGGGTITYDFKVNGNSVQNGSSNIYTTSALADQDAVTVDISVAGGTCLTTATATSNSVATTVNANLTPTVSISSDATGNAICSGMTVTFTATASNTGGGTVTYDFKVGGTSVQSGSSNTYTTSSLVDGNAVTVDISIAGGICLTTATASSSAITMTVSANLTPTVNLASSAGTAICAGTEVTFTATAGNTGGGTITYDFKVAGISVQSGSSNTYTTSSLASGDAVTVDISVTGGTCLTTTTATSNSIATTVNTNLTPIVSLASSAGTAICTGTEVTFTATASNTGGGTITYDFKVGGISVQSGSSNTYTTSSLANGDAVTVDISVTGGTCLTTTTATSNSIATTVNANLTPTVSISSSEGNVICAGTSVTFTATASNTGGGTITYDFKVGGTSVQSGSSNTYTTSSLADGNTVTVDISIAGGTCLTTPTASSSAITMTVNANLTPTVSISSSEGNAICAGTSVTFTATASNTGGGTITYDFKVGGTSVQSGSSNTYTTSSLVDGNAVTVDISIAGGTCLTTATASSSAITMTVNANLTPTVSISSSEGNAICAGTSVTFTATASNTGGGTITYDFKVGGTSVQSGSSNTYTTSSLASGDAVTVDVSVTGGTCLTTTTATSNSIATTVNTNLTPIVSLASSAGTAICAGTEVTFTATASNTGGGTITYDFKVAGISVQSGSSNTYTTSSLASGDAVTVDISVTGGTCLTTTTATSNSIATTVNANLTPIVSLASSAGAAICAGTEVTFTATASNTGGGTITYDFKVGGTSVQSGSSNTYTTSSLGSGEAVTVDISVTGGTCLTTTTATSNSIATTVNTNLTPIVSLASSAGTAICAGTEVTFTATASNTGGGTITYDFKVNGISAQTGSSNTYSTSALVDQDAVTVDISVTGGTCLTTTTATSNSIATTVNANLTPTVSLTSSAGTTICAGTEVTFTATASATGGGTITYDFKVGGTSVQSGTSNTYTTSSLASGDAVTVDISVAGGTCLTTTTATSNSIATAVNANLTPTVSISSSEGNAICAGTSVTFTATASNTGGGTIIYDFKVGGTSVQSGSSNTYTTSSLVDGNAVTVDISIAGGTCLTATTASSSAITMTVNATLTPTVNLASNAGTTICAGTSVTFTATANATGGGTITYDFKVGGSSVQSGSSNTYTTSSLVDGNAVTVDISVTGGTCLTATTASSSAITMTVNATLTPTVSLASSAGTTICAGTEVTFTATAANTGGGTITYDFKVGGSSVQNSSSNTYTTSGLVNNDAVTVDISIAGGTCLTATTASSSTITMTVNANLTPTVSLASSAGTTICAGTSVTFTATASNTGGGTVTYDFKVGGSSVQNSSSNTYTTSALVNNDAVTVDISIAGGTCLTATTASSSAITMTVNATLTPTVSIASDAAGNTTCAGSTVIFTATASNTGGGTLTYTFKVNGASVQSGSSNTYTTSALADQDAVTCDISIAGGTCLTTTTATSSAIVTTVTASLTPTVSIASNASGNTICSGTSVTFTATTGNTGGGTVTYNFKVNGGSVQNGSSNTYTTSTLANQDAVTCEITITGGICLTTTTVTSNSIVTTVNATLTPTVSLTSNATNNTICAGASVVFTATATNAGGGTVTYNFKVNGGSVQNGSSNTYSTSALVNQDAVTCEIAITGGTCLTATTATSGTVTMTVNAIPAAPVISKGEGELTFCQGGSVVLFSNSPVGNQWYQNSAAISETDPVYTAEEGGNYTATVTLNGCESPQSNVITVTVNTPPTVDPITGVTTVVGTGTTQLADATAGGTWSIDNAAIATIDANGLVTGVAVGSTVVNYTVTNGCGPTTVHITINVVAEPGGGGRTVTSTTATTSSTGRASLSELKLDVTAMPNPTTDYFNLVVKGTLDKPISVRVVDAIGTIVEVYPKLAPGTVLRLGEKWRGGPYFIEVIQGNERKTIKVLKTN